MAWLNATEEVVDTFLLKKMMRNLFSRAKPRAPASGSDPSNIVGENVDCEGAPWLTAATPMDNPYCSCKLTHLRSWTTTEDDVLHIRHLPDFDATLRARDSELLLQYLTVPYLRIPLVLEFFCDPVRLMALSFTAAVGVLHRGSP